MRHAKTFIIFQCKTPLSMDLTPFLFSGFNDFLDTAVRRFGSSPV